MVFVLLLYYCSCTIDLEAVACDGFSIGYVRKLKHMLWLEHELIELDECV